MDFLIDVLLLLAGLVLVDRSNTDRDEVWRLCLRILAVMSVLAVITSDRGLPLAWALLAFALWLPGAARMEKALDQTLARGDANPPAAPPR